MEQYINRLPLSEVTANTKNPRTISEARLQKLIDSLLVFPRMLYMRPVIIDGESVVLGSNMRLEALHRIARMTMDDVTARLEGRREYEAMSEAVREKLRSLWASFLGSPTVPCVRAADLTADEREQFIIKDNVSFGDWDWSELETWDADKLTDWGVDMLVTQSDIDIDDFFENSNNHHLPQKGFKITITCPLALEEKKEEIIDLMKEVLKPYGGVKVG